MAFELFKSGQELWQMALEYLSGENGRPKNYAEARRLFEKAQKSGYYEKGYSPLAYMYYYGLGMEQDYHKAFTYVCMTLKRTEGYPNGA